MASWRKVRAPEITQDCFQNDALKSGKVGVAESFTMTTTNVASGSVSTSASFLTTTFFESTCRRILTTSDADIWNSRQISSTKRRNVSWRRRWTTFFFVADAKLTLVIGKPSHHNLIRFPLSFFYYGVHSGGIRTLELSTTSPFFYQLVRVRGNGTFGSLTMV